MTILRLPTRALMMALMMACLKELNRPPPPPPLLEAALVDLLVGKGARLTRPPRLSSTLASCYCCIHCFRLTSSGSGWHGPSWASSRRPSSPQSWSCLSWACRCSRAWRSPQWLRVLPRSWGPSWSWRLKKVGVISDIYMHCLLAVKVTFLISVLPTRGI